MESKGKPPLHNPGHTWEGSGGGLHALGAGAALAAAGRFRKSLSMNIRV